MKKIFAAALLCASLNVSANSSRAGDFGLGGMVGTMLSATGKYWISDKGAIDFGVGVWHPAAVGYVDYLWRLKGLFGHGSRFGRETDAYIGAGGGLGFWSNYCAGSWRCKDRDDNRTGTVVFVRAMFGMEWVPSKVPIGVFAEVGPAIEFMPVTGGLASVGAGCRYYFP